MGPLLSISPNHCCSYCPLGSTHDKTWFLSLYHQPSPDQSLLCSHVSFPKTLFSILSRPAKSQLGLLPHAAVLMAIPSLLPQRTTSFSLQGVPYLILFCPYYPNNKHSNATFSTKLSLISQVEVIPSTCKPSQNYLTRLSEHSELSALYYVHDQTVGFMKTMRLFDFLRNPHQDDLWGFRAQKM